MPEWLTALIGPGNIGAVIAGVVGIVIAAIQKRRTAPERRLDALDGFERLVKALQLDADRAGDDATEAREEARASREEARKARDETAAKQAVIEVLESRLRVALAYAELLRAHITSGKPPPPPDYPEGLL